MEKDLILKTVDLIKHNASHYQTKLGYYMGQHDILGRKIPDPDKPNNHTVVNYAKYIADVQTSYFIGVPVTYNTNVDNEAFWKAFSDVHEYNDIDDHNTNLVYDMGIYGKSYEFLFVGEHHRTGNPIIRIGRMNPAETAVIYDDSMIPEMVGAIRCFSKEEPKETNEAVKQYDRVEYVDVYDSEKIARYKIQDRVLTLLEEWEHFFNDVPVVEYKNNEFELGDFDMVMTLIDAYNLMTSDSINDAEEFVNSYLVLKGFNGTEPEDVIDMKTKRTLLADQEDDAYFLVRNVNDKAEENRKTRLQNDIHKISNVPDLSDDKFGQNLSGVAIAYKLWGLEQAASIKERKFTKGLQRRAELICNYLQKIGIMFDYTDIDYTFTRNMPTNVVEMIGIALQAGAQISQETILSWIPGVDPVQEVERIQQQREETVFPELFDDNAEG